MMPRFEPVLPTISIPQQTAGDLIDRSWSGDPLTAYVRYTLATGQDIMNIGIQVGQAGAFFGFGRLGMLPFKITHATLVGSLMTEFVWGTLALAAFWLIVDPEDHWTEEHAIFGFHGIQQTGTPATEEAKRQAIVSSEMNVYEHMRIGSMA